MHTNCRSLCIRVIAHRAPTGQTSAISNILTNTHPMRSFTDNLNCHFSVPSQYPFLCPCPCILPCYLPLFCNVPSLLQPIMPSVLFSEEAQISRAIRCGPRLCTRKRLAMSSIVIGLILFTLGMFALLYIPIALKDGVTSNMIVDSSSAPLYASPPAFFLCSIH